MNKSDVIGMICSLIAIVPSFMASAQDLRLGDRLPDMTVKNVINYKDSALQFSTFNGKWIILNFWNHGCEANITPFQKFDSIQKRFAGNIQIIMVNKESKDSTVRFFQKRKDLKLPSLPFITSGDELWKLFSKDATPYQVWVNKNEEIKYITNPYNLNTRHISQLLKGERPIILNRSSAQHKTETKSHKFLFASTIALCLESKDVGNVEGLIEENMVRVSSTCVSARDLFLKAFRQRNKYPLKTSKEVALEIDNVFSFNFPTDESRIDEWRQNYSYTYELQIPAALKASRYEFMQQDLQRFFNVTAKIEKRKIKSLVLVKKGHLGNLISKGGKPFDNLLPSTLKKDPLDSIAILRNLPFKVLAEKLSHWCAYYLDMPFVDNTEFKENIDVQLSQAAIDVFDFNIIRNNLKKYNLEFQETEEWVNVLVIKKRE